MSDGRTAGRRHAELITGASDSPLTTDRCPRRRCTIHLTIAGFQPDPAALVIAVHPQRDAVRVVPAGELDVATVGALHAQLDELHDAGFKGIVLDLRKLTFMDSNAVRLIVNEDRLARGAGRRFSLIKGPPAVQRVLDVCGLAPSLEFAGPPAAVSPALRAPTRLVVPGRASTEVALQG